MGFFNVGHCVNVVTSKNSLKFANNPILGVELIHQLHLNFISLFSEATDGTVVVTFAVKCLGQYYFFFT